MTDLADFRARPEHYLVSVDREGKRAAALWFDRATRNPHGSDGLVHLLYHGQQLIPLDLWDEVTGIWLALLDVLEGFLAAGDGNETLSGQPVSVAMKGTPRSATFTANSMSHKVDPAIRRSGHSCGCRPLLPLGPPRHRRRARRGAGPDPFSPTRAPANLSGPGRSLET